jgi:hypothetical protein
VWRGVFFPCSKFSPSVEVIVSICKQKNADTGQTRDQILDSINDSPLSYLETTRFHAEENTQSEETESNSRMEIIKYGASINWTGPVLNS